MSFFLVSSTMTSQPDKCLLTEKINTCAFSLSFMANAGTSPKVLEHGLDLLQ